MIALIEALDHPEDADLTLLEKSAAPASSAPSLANMQILQGVVIAVGIMLALALLAFGLQFLRR